MTLIGGLPAHPLVVHLVVVVLPLAALGTVLLAVRPSWRRHLGPPVFLLALAGVLAVPVATWSGDQLEHALGGENPLIKIHEDRAETLLTPAVLFLVLLTASLFFAWRADRAATMGGGSGTTTSTTTTTTTWLTTGLGILAALAGLLVTGLVVWIGHAGSTAVWQGVISQ